ncbi:MAG TPA: VOC family protein [Candidatus Kapabacteria bacterium]|nr:VOC family protein [Candidatus Kapabacteria bacterium]
MALHGINHLVLKVRDLAVADRFYRGLVGLELVGSRPGMNFYSAGAHHHDFALLEVGADAAVPSRRETGLFHFCFDVSDEAALAEIYHRLREAGVDLRGTADHNVMRSFYVRDPDGNLVEFGVDVPRDEWAAPADAFAGDRPYAIAG